MPVANFRTVTLKSETVERLNDYSKRAGITTPNLISKIVDILERNKDFKSFEQTLEVSTRLNETLLLRLLRKLSASMISIRFYATTFPKTSLGEEKIQRLIDGLNEAEQIINDLFARIFPKEYEINTEAKKVEISLLNEYRENSLKLRTTAEFGPLFSFGSIDHHVKELKEYVEDILNILGMNQLYFTLGKCLTPLDLALEKIRSDIAEQYPTLVSSTEEKAKIDAKNTNEYNDIL